MNLIFFSIFNNNKSFIYCTEFCSVSFYPMKLLLVSLLIASKFNTFTKTYLLYLTDKIKFLDKNNK